MVSIIMSVFNVEQYLEKCFDSILNQTYKNIELIVVNDGSTDKSINIISKYRKEFPNIVYVEQENKGLSEARNLGLKIAKGKYILYVDSDDYLESNMLDLIVNKIEKENSDMVIIGHSEFYDNNAGRKYDVYLEVNEEKQYTGLEVADLMLRCKIMGVAWNKLYKREILIKENFIFEYGRYTQDWYPVFKHITKLKKISFINKPLYNYRLRETSTTNKKNEKRLEDYSYAVNSIINYLDNEKLELNKNSIYIFKIKTFENIISLYYSINKNNTGISRKFKKSKFYNEIYIMKALFLKEFSIVSKIKLLAWKLNLYEYILYIENNIRKIKGRELR